MTEPNDINVAEVDQEDAESWDEERRLEILARLIMRAERGGTANGDAEKTGRVLEPNVC